MDWVCGESIRKFKYWFTMRKVKGRKSNLQEPLGNEGCLVIHQSCSVLLKSKKRTRFVSVENHLTPKGSSSSRQEEGVG